MLKKIFALSMLLVSISALAQNPAPQVNAVVDSTEKNAAIQFKLDHSFCRYEDKTYSEGAVKQVGTTSLRCGVRSRTSFRAQDDDVAKELIWLPHEKNSSK